jgi:DNA-binding protein HU-beta
MTRQELAQKVGVNDQTMKKVFETIKEEVKNGNKVDIYSFGSFQAVDRAARQARNPQTGEIVHVVPKKAVKFKASKNFKDLLN